MFRRLFGAPQASSLLAPGGEFALVLFRLAEQVGTRNLGTSTSAIGPGGPGGVRAHGAMRRASRRLPATRELTLLLRRARSAEELQSLVRQHGRLDQNTRKSDEIQAKRGVNKMTSDENRLKPVQNALWRTFRGRGSMASTPSRLSSGSASCLEPLETSSRRPKTLENKGNSYRKPLKK